MATIKFFSDITVDSTLIADDEGLEFPTSAGTPVATTADGTISIDTTNDLLYFRSGAAWISAASALSSVNELTDVNTAGPEVGDILVYDGTSWIVNQINEPLNVPDSVLLLDSFTDTNGTNLTAHTPDTPVGGNAWIKQATGDIEIQSNAANDGTTNSAESFYTYDVLDPNVEIEVELFFSAADIDAGVIWHYTDASNYGIAILETATDNLVIREVVAGTPTNTSVNVTGGIGATTTYNLKVYKNNGVITAVIDDNETVSYTSTFSLDTLIGFYKSSSSTVSVDWDNLTVSTLVNLVGNLNNTFDVDITAPADGEVLSYNSTSGNWENAVFTTPIYTEQIGDGAASSFVVTHNLGTKAVGVQVYETASPYEVVFPLVSYTSINSVTIDFDTTVPTSNQYSVVVK